MKFQTCLLFVSILISNLPGQSFNFQFNFGKFENASSFYISSSGFLYITDSGTNEIYQYDTLGNFIKEEGGYGWNDDAFDDPADIYANPLNVYVSDKNNHRIKRYDKNLNFISSLYTRDRNNPDELFGYPLSCVISSQGDIYILDSENKRIVKFDLFGKFTQSFGGYDAGEYSLADPRKLSVSPAGYLYVLDKKKIIIFDQYGNGINIIRTEVTFNSINILFNNLTANSEDEIFYSILNSSDNSLKQLKLSGYDDLPDFRSTLIYNNKLYVLTPAELFVFIRSEK